MVIIQNLQTRKPTSTLLRTRQSAVGTHRHQARHEISLANLGRLKGEQPTTTMDADEDWNKLLNDHPIFRFPKGATGVSQDSFKSRLELSTNTLPRFIEFDSQNDDPTPSGRRQTMILKDADLIVAVGKELRVTSLGDMKLGRSTRKSYKVRYLANMKYGSLVFNRRRCCTPRI